MEVLSPSHFLWVLPGGLLGGAAALVPTTQAYLSAGDSAVTIAWLPTEWYWLWSLEGNGSVFRGNQGGLPQEL